VDALKILLVAMAWQGVATSQPMADSPRFVETIVPALAYNAACSSSVSVQNLASRDVWLQIEAHRSDGALVALEGHEVNEFLLAAGESGAYKLRLKDDPGDAWVKIRERIPSPGLSPAIAISGVTECVGANELSTADRVVAYPLTNPRFSEPAEKFSGEAILLINASEQPARAWACESPVGYYSVPSTTAAPARSHPLCSAEFEVQIAPFGTRRFPIRGAPDSSFLLETRGDHIVLQMLKPVKNSVRLYSVDSSISFGEEAPGSVVKP